MPSETITGVVLRYANYRERDRMLTLLSPDHGRVDVLSRGCRKPGSPLMPSSELFVQGDFVLFRQQDRYTLPSCAITEPFYSLRLDAYRLTCATYLVNLAPLAAQPEQAAPGLFRLLLQGLYHLTYGKDDQPALSVTNAYLLLYAAETGYRPRLNHCVRCGEPLPRDRGAKLDMVAGGLCCSRCTGGEQVALTAQQITWMRDVLAKGFDAPLGSADPLLFEALRRYVEHRLECSIKSSQFLP